MMKVHFRICFFWLFFILKKIEYVIEPVFRGQETPENSCLLKTGHHVIEMIILFYAEKRGVGKHAELLNCGCMVNLGVIFITY